MLLIFHFTLTWSFSHIVQFLFKSVYTLKHFCSFTFHHLPPTNLTGSSCLLKTKVSCILIQSSKKMVETMYPKINRRLVFGVPQKHSCQPLKFATCYVYAFDLCHFEIRGFELQLSVNTTMLRLRPNIGAQSTKIEVLRVKSRK